MFINTTAQSQHFDELNFLINCLINFITHEIFVFILSLFWSTRNCSQTSICSQTSNELSLDFVFQMAITYVKVLGFNSNLI